ncbi:MAG: sigma-54-dependent Fis family transcriptional regulator [Cyclobacteriaceae bacterium]|nr:sigma-54-dependent Fis family transcriptional regulator [Cyclobacteriaceae bacterium]
MPSSRSVLIIDDEENLRTLMARVIELEGFKVIQAKDAKQGLKSLEHEDVQVVITDVRLPDGNGIDLTRTIKEKFATVEVIALTAFGTIEDGVTAIKNGAFDYLTKGDHQQKLIPLLNKAYEKAALQQKVKQLEARLVKQFGFEQVLGKSKAIREAIELAKKVAVTENTVLLTGETGTGKEVFAHAIHYESNRRAKPFVAFNCSAIAKDLLESELFGYAAGAFTNATRDKRGLLEEAQGGTLFLDEIGELNAELQTKLLRTLESGEYYRVGDSKIRKADVRFIAATNRQLEKEIEAGHFRSDLFYRLSVFQITLPSLRERTEDIAILAEYFIQQTAAKSNRRMEGYDARFLKLLQQHPWKGNIRELKNVIERSVILSSDKILTADLLPYDFNVGEINESSLTLADLEKHHIQKVLALAQGNKTKAAKLLDIGLTTLYQKIKDYNL